MKRCILACDFLGFQPNVTIEGKNRFSTLFSALLSIQVVILTIFCVIYFGWNLVYKTDPYVLVTNKVYDNFDPLNMSNKGFNFVFAMENQFYQYYSDPSIFSVSANLTINKNILLNNSISQLSETIPVSIDLCSKYYSDDDMLEKNLFIPLNLFYCLKPNEVVINGFFGKDLYTLVTIYVTKCVNSTVNNNTCKSQDIIDNAIQGSYISIDMTSAVVNQTNNIAPLARNFYNSYNLLNTNSSLFYAYHIYPTIFNSDEGLLATNIKTYSGYSAQQTLFNVISRTDNIVTFSFEGYSSGSVYSRSYVKIQTVVTQVGGFIKFVMIFANLISNFITQSYFYISYISNNSISFNPLVINSRPNSLDLMSKSANSKQFHKGNCFNNIHSTKILFKNQNPNRNLNRQIALKNRRFNSRLILYLFQTIFICTKRRAPFNIIEKMGKLFKQSMSIDYITKSFIDLEILKNNSQLNLNFSELNRITLEKKLKNK